MNESFLNGKIVLHCGDLLAVLPTLEENSIDSVVCDPPYHLVSIVKRFGADDAAPAKVGKTGAYARSSAGFMGKQWDGGDIAFQVETWAQVIRVLKPGGHLIAFSSTRTYHRMACAIEDAGFEIRDQIGWCYGSGFPKSHDVSKGIDKAAGVEFEEFPASGVGFMGPDKPGGYNRTIHQLKRAGKSTDAAREWQGWGTALKPAWECLVLARKPLSEPTIAANVLKWGTGALNINGCRIDAIGMTKGGNCIGNSALPMNADAGIAEARQRSQEHALGRWPANIIHDGSEEVLAVFPDVGISSGGIKPGFSTKEGWARPSHSEWHASASQGGFGDSGSAARFFYQVKQDERSEHSADLVTFDIIETSAEAGESAYGQRLFYTSKADSDDRLGSKHPTVKPLDLMQYLVRLVTPPRGTVLDCFAGTGTTGEAAFREGFRAVLIEREAEYQADIRRRMGLVLGGPDERARAAIKERMKDKPIDAGPLFGGAE